MALRKIILTCAVTGSADTADKNPVAPASPASPASRDEARRILSL
jgi:uncharacterized protein (DUF849 family)